MNKFNILKYKSEEILKMGWIKCKRKGSSAAELLFEELIGIPTNNLETADFKGIEIKTKISKKEDYISLFCAAPDSYLFEIKRIYEEYAYYDKNKKFKVFNISVYGNKKIYIGNNKFCKLKVDYKKELILLIVIDRHGNVVDDKTAWSFKIIQEKIERKLKYLLMVYGDRKFELGEVFYKYKTYEFYKFRSFENFLDAIEMGYIRISFTIGVFKTGKRIGEIHDHGTCFNINKYFLNSIFKKIENDLWQ